VLSVLMPTAATLTVIGPASPPRGCSPECQRMCSGSLGRLSGQPKSPSSWRISPEAVQEVLTAGHCGDCAQELAE